MDLTPTEEQRLLRESVERFAAGRYAPDQRKQYAAGPHGYSAAMWAEMAGLGWLALSIPEAQGGLGAGAVETGIVMEGAGRALMAEPLLPAAVAAAVIAGLGDTAQAERWLPAIAEGRLLAVLAHAERHMRLDRGTVRTEATREGDGWRLRGAKDSVMAGGGAGLLLVTARVGAGMGVFAVETGAARQVYPVVGGGTACNATLDVAVGAEALLGGRDDAEEVVAAALDLGCVGVAAESVGCMSALLAATTAYTRTRTQFGRPLSDNQVLRHRMVDMAIACEEARAIALRAAVLMEGPGRARAASAAKARTSRAARFVAEQAVQLHGGMGVTDELDVGEYFKRLLAIDAQYGTGAEHLARHARLREPSWT
jgi:alkylation response protein AidB-like acyl-CoA dehydrogenase